MFVREAELQGRRGREELPSIFFLTSKNSLERQTDANREERELPSFGSFTRCLQHQGPENLAAGAPAGVLAAVAEAQPLKHHYILPGL